MTAMKKPPKLRHVVQLMRVKHWLKNLLIFIPITFSGRLLEVQSLATVVGGFLAFSFLSSAVYILNDIQDADADRQHEVKKHRPIAAGLVSIPAAYGIFGVLLVAALGIHWLICGFSGRSFLLLCAYFLVNVGYSLGLKHVPFMDILLLVLGFLLRVLYGAEIIQEGVSQWVLLTIISLSFYLGLGKRRNELLKTNGQTGASTRKVLQYYSFNFLDKFMYLCLAIAIVFYALWSADAEVIQRFQTDKLIWTVPFVILLMMKYSADIETDSYGDPVDVILHDKILLLLALLYAVLMLLLIYVPGI